MAEMQGSAETKLRGDTMLMVANANIMGWLDDDGIWRGERITDWDAFSDTFAIGTSPEVLGGALRKCLLSSRVMTGDWAGLRRRDGDYNERLARAFGLLSVRDLYPGMKDVSIDWSRDVVRFGPSRNRRGGVFEGFEIGADRGHEAIVLPFDTSNEEFGVALLETLRRCL